MSLTVGVLGALMSGPSVPAGATGGGLAYAAVGRNADDNATLVVGTLGGSAHVIYQSDQPAGVQEPAVSPDGQLVAFVENHGAHAPRLAIVHVDGSGHQWLMGDVSNQGLSTPVWSPDGRDIYIGVQKQTGNYRAYVVPANGSTGGVAISHGANARPEAVRRDGRVLAFDFVRSGDRYQRTGVMDVDGSNRHAVGETNLWDAAWRPRSAVLGVTRVVRDNGAGVAIQIQILNVRTGKYRPLTATQSPNAYGDAYPLAWSSDGTYLYYEYIAYRDGGPRPPRIYRIRLDGTGRTDVTPPLPRRDSDFALEGR